MRPEKTVLARHEVPWQSPVSWFLRLSNTNVIAFRGLFASKTIPFEGTVGAVPPEGIFLVPARKIPLTPAGEGLLCCSRNQSHLPRPLQARTIVGAVYISPPKKVVYLGDRTAPMDRAKRIAFLSENRSTHDFSCCNPYTPLSLRGTKCRGNDTEF